VGRKKGRRRYPEFVVAQPEKSTLRRQNAGKGGSLKGIIRKRGQLGSSGRGANYTKLPIVLLSARGKREGKKNYAGAKGG